jgi:DNA repair protein SbcD/Mre11
VTVRARFVHAADLHLGYEQYNLLKRADDFAKAYLAVVEHTIESRADFLLLAGDLFHRASADAWMLKQAIFGLELLRAASIPVVAVEGNHDAQFVRKNLSWMELLCDQGLLHLLNIHIAPNGHKSLAPWDAEERRGSYLDLAGVRIYGMKYYGAATARHLEEIRDEIEPGAYTILMLHAGMEGQVPHLHGGLTHGQVEPLHQHIDYLALGHIHKRLQTEWIFNPGSTETNSMEELEWPHGFFDVSVDTDSPDKHSVHAIETPTLRPFHRVLASAEGRGSVEEFVAHVEETIAESAGIAKGAVIELVLAGVAEFRRQDVPLERLKGAVELRHQPLLARVRNALVPPGVVSVRHAEHTPRAELEREIVEMLVSQQAAYRHRSDAWARLVLDVKNMSVEEQPAANIVDHVQRGLKDLYPSPPGPLPLKGGGGDSEDGDPARTSLIPGNSPQCKHDQNSPLEGEGARGRGEPRHAIESQPNEDPITIAGDPVDTPPDSASW